MVRPYKGSARGSASPHGYLIENCPTRTVVAALLIIQPHKARLQLLDLGSLTQFTSGPAEEPKWNNLRGQSGSVRTSRYREAHPKGEK
jgi:hypothetical protein